MRHETVDAMVRRCIPENALPDQWEVDTLREECQRIFNLDPPIADWAKEEGIAEQEIRERLGAIARFYGNLIGVKYGEPFVVKETMRVDDIAALGVRSL
jgi:preprotein translocase subunit SecA